ncbi:MAG: cell division protein FtsQ/DivIB [Putridiphycobacter sp.]
MNSWLKNILWLVFVILIFVAMSFVQSSKNQQEMGLPEVDIDVFEDQVFLTKDDIYFRLKNQQLIQDQNTFESLDFEAIEGFLNQMSEIKSVEVYTKIGNSWGIKIKLRKAIARIFNLDGSSCYLDSDGSLMPLSPNYTAHVLTVNGYINENDFSKTVSEVINNDSLKTIEILDDLYDISNYVCLNEFLSSQITHIYVNANQEFELIPRIGNQRILFGKAEDIAGKFKKFEIFYKEGMPNAGWEKYDTINVMFKNQVVCSKR